MSFLSSQRVQIKHFVGSSSNICLNRCLMMMMICSFMLFTLLQAQGSTGKFIAFLQGFTYSHEHTSKYHQTLVKRDPPKVLKSKAWMPQHFQIFSRCRQRRQVFQRKSMMKLMNEQAFRLSEMSSTLTTRLFFADVRHSMQDMRKK